MMVAGEVRAYVGLGSNLDDPAAQLRTACLALTTAGWSDAIAISPTYRSPALTGSGVPTGQPDYLNAVVGLTTALPPAELLRELLQIETAQGRERGQRWAARSLDLDLLLYGDRIVAAPGLIVPHPALAERTFVLRPLVDLAPDLVVPSLGPAADLLADLLATVDTAPLEQVD
jgi:2-amino-4-hydroxy-6-hydroxymethyldihydropteridine diphosphokinase